MCESEVKVNSDQHSVQKFNKKLNEVCLESAGGKGQIDLRVSCSVLL